MGKQEGFTRSDCDAGQGSSRRLSVGHGDRRFKASADALPPAAAAALSRRPPRPGLPGCDRRSVLSLCPGLLCTQHGIGDAHQLAHHGDQREALGFAGTDQAAIEAAERRIMLDDGQTGGEQRRADLWSPALDMSLAAHPAAVVVGSSAPVRPGQRSCVGRRRRVRAARR
jgi:hypothetical protein